MRCSQLLGDKILTTHLLGHWVLVLLFLLVLTKVEIKVVKNAVLILILILGGVKWAKFLHLNDECNYSTLYSMIPIMKDII